MNSPTREFLDDFRERARQYGWLGDYVAIRDFVEDLYRKSDIDPSDLDFEPYEVDG